MNANESESQEMHLTFFGTLNWPLTPLILSVSKMLHHINYTWTFYSHIDVILTHGQMIRFHNAFSRLNK